jgi:flagellar basal-body rod modification protein FlgD
MSTSAINTLASAPVFPGPPASTAPASDALASQSVFLQLLIAQLKNQDPQNPADGTQFITQLAQFTTLEQQTQATTDLNSILSLMQLGDSVAGGATGSSGESSAGSGPGTKVGTGFGSGAGTGIAGASA